MDNAHLTAYDPDTQGQYYVIDTTIDTTQTANLKPANGRQGDTMRRVPLAIVDDDQPHDMTNSTIELRGQDSAGVVKVSDVVLNWVSREGGLLIFGIPAPFYKNVGQYQHAYFVISDKDSQGNTTSTSTININFFVTENGIDVSDVDSTIYISSVDRMLQTAKDRIEAVKIAGENASAIVKGYQNSIKSGDFPAKDDDNNWTGHNSFKAVTIDSLDNAQLLAVSNNVTTAQATANSASLQAVSNSVLISNHADSIAANSTAVSSVNDRLGIDETNASTVSTAVSNHTESISSLSAAVDNMPEDLTDSLNAVSNSVTTLSHSVSNFNNSVTVSLTNMSIAVENASDMTQSVNVINQSVVAMNKQLSYVSDTADTASNHINTLFSAVTELVNTVNQNIENKKLDGNNINAPML
ncbi:hypothetical protein DN445_03970 [Lactobacillus reuteri]|uniref:BppU family phage baseplate upper protein n=1 Tax=Limosilactobacillus reuteri TaxID=1598 RepID=UPI00128E7129|nr:BppU family phage baseplate upper protein [Limosilactobacillus reuteri]MQB62831.1 hypothetical protein [Limosilactobacillus reuteri]MQB71004.1 hypothetical protein [Limosilactobacillus reuteri]